MNEIDLTNYLKKRYKFQKINDVEVDGKKYIFKLLPKDNLYNYKFVNFYNDLIFSELCKKLGISCCSVYLARYKNIYGTLIESYKTNVNANYINGSVILKDYLNYLIKNHLVEDCLDEKVNYPVNDDYKDCLVHKMNNLETIWDALNYHYKNLNELKRNEIIGKIMDELTTRYSLDYLLMQPDRHEKNWEIIELHNDAYLTPLFDNELSFYYYNYIPDLKIDINDKINYNSQLEKFLSFSSQNFKDKFVNLYNILTPEYLENTIKELEIKENFTFPVLYKKDILNNYSKQYNDITNILNELKNKR